MSIIGVTVNDADVKQHAAAEPTQGQHPVWEELIRSVRTGKYQSDYEVGELIPISVGKFGSMHARIVAMDADQINGSEKKAALSFLLSMPLPDDRQMNPEWGKEDPEDSSLFVPGTGAIDGWKACSLRKYLQEEVLTEFPQIVRENIVPVLKTSRTFTAKSQVFDVMTVDKLWIPSRREVFGPGRFTELTGPVYSEVFEDDDDRVMRDCNGSASWWWLRSASDYYGFSLVHTSGDWGNSGASDAGGVVVGFCIESGI